MGKPHLPLLPPPDDTLVNKTFRIKEETWQKLRAVSGRYQRTPSDVIRYLIDDFLERAEGE
jgi:predicted DNA-binding protein